MRGLQYFRRSVRSIWLASLVCTFLLLAETLPVHAQQDARSVRAAFVYNLTKYVTWPQPKQNLVIGVIGDERTGTTLKQMLDQQSSGGQKVRVLLNPPDSELATCNIVYISSSETVKTGNILSGISKMPILTIGESDHFVRNGGIVGLIRSQDQIQIEVNVDALQLAGLKMSSRVLNIANVISTRGH